MPRISSYAYDTEINDNDSWIGTENSNKLTRNFTAAAVAQYLNIKAKISIGGQMVFKFTGPNPDTGAMSGQVDGTNFSAINNLTLSDKDHSGQTVTNFLGYLNKANEVGEYEVPLGNQILINQQGNIDNFGHYAITGYTTDPTHGSPYSEITLKYLSGNGALSYSASATPVNYAFTVFNLYGATYVYDKATPGSSWEIEHNLNKYPSVVTSTSSGVVYGDIEYNNKNKLTINFNGSFSGTAFLN